MFRTPLTAVVATALAALAMAAPIPSAHPGPTDAVVVPVAFCGGKAQGFAFHKYGSVSEGNCGVAGHPGFRINYSWHTEDGKACVDGWGFDEGHPKGTWFSLGCGEKSFDYGKEKGIPWGNVLAKPRVRVFSQDSLRGVLVEWSAG
jgi:hypothetical protein